MDSNKTDTPPWYLKGPIRDWVIIIGGIGFFYLNTVGSNAAQQARQETISSDITEIKNTISSDITEIKNTIKEQHKEDRILTKELELRLNKMELEIELIKEKVTP